MLMIIYLCGFCLVLSIVVVRYDSIVPQIGYYKQLYPSWMVDLVGAIVSALWPLLLLVFIRGCYLEFESLKNRKEK